MAIRKKRHSKTPSKNQQTRFQTKQFRPLFLLALFLLAGIATTLQIPRLTAAYKENTTCSTQCKCLIWKKTCECDHEQDTLSHDNQAFHNQNPKNQDPHNQAHPSQELQRLTHQNQHQKKHAQENHNQAPQDQGHPHTQTESPSSIQNTHTSITTSDAHNESHPECSMVPEQSQLDQMVLLYCDQNRPTLSPTFAPPDYASNPTPPRYFHIIPVQIPPPQTHV